MNYFFTHEDTQKQLSKLRESLFYLEKRLTESVHKERATIAHDIISQMLKNPSQWDDKCQHNIRQIGNDLKNFTFHAGKVINIAEVNNVFTLCFAFLSEFEFMGGEFSEANFTASMLVAWALSNASSDEENPDLKIKLTNIALQLPARILKDFLSSEEIKHFAEFNAKAKDAERKISLWREDLDKRELKVEQLKSSLEKYEKGFNFVGLHQGFNELNTRKKREAGILTALMIIVAIALSIPLINTINYVKDQAISGQIIDFKYLLILLPIISLEIILIYLFRVALLEYKSVKTQIMQLELRMTLCQFIQSYIEKAQEMKKQDSSSLEKFENLIFSNILSDPHDVPSTFDGIEQIGNIIKNFKTP